MTARTKVGFRVDAAPHIGNGHGFRCLALANALRERDVSSVFLSRSLTEDVERRLRAAGHEVWMLDAPPPSGPREAPELAHAAWLDRSPTEDATEVAARLAASGGEVGLLTYDHYALDARWSAPLRKAGTPIAVIDDLADRSHDCDLLVDTNFYEGLERRYDGLVPKDARLRLGPAFALLRPEFTVLRDEACCGELDSDRLMISLGGVDRDNVTSVVLDALDRLAPFDAVDVVIGSGHPARAVLEARCADLGYGFHVDTPRFAALLADATLVVGAGGTTTWERMCLGAPTLALSVAKNQTRMLQDVSAAGLLAFYDGALDDADAVAAALARLRANPSLRRHFHDAGRALVGGRGLSRIADDMLSLLKDQ